MAGWKPTPGLTEKDVREILDGSEELRIMDTAVDAADLRERLVKYWSDEKARVTQLLATSAPPPRTYR